MKIKVIELEATKLDPNAHYLIVFSKRQLTPDMMYHVADRLVEIGVKAVYTMAEEPEKAVKIYQIPKQEKQK